MLFFVVSLTSNLGISGVKGAKPLAPWCAQEWFHISQMSHEEEPPYVSIEPSIPIPRDSHSLNKVRRRERLNKCKIQSALTHFEMLVNRKYNCVWLLQCVFFLSISNFGSFLFVCLSVCIWAKQYEYLSKTTNYFQPDMVLFAHTKIFSAP